MIDTTGGQIVSLQDGQQVVSIPVGQEVLTLSGGQEVLTLPDGTLLHQVASITPIQVSIVFDLQVQVNDI